MKYSVKLLLFICGCYSTAFSYNKQEPVNMHLIQLLKNEEFGNSKAMQLLFELTDVNGPRVTGSTGMRNAEAWAAQTLKDWGLSNVSIENWGGFGKGWDINKCYVAMKTPYYQALIGVPRAWTSSTPGPITADAIAVKIDNAQDFEKYAGKLTGKIVVLGQQNNELKLGFTPDAKRLTEEELEKMIFDQHLDENSASLLPTPAAPIPPKPATFGRKQIDSFFYNQGVAAVLSGGRGNMGTIFTSNGSSRAWNASPVVPELEIGSEHLNRLFRLLNAGKTVQLEVDIQTTFLTKDSTECNVVAEIPGTDPTLKDELVLLGGHMDSWHASTGATDNGTGVIVAMEAIRLLKVLNVKPKRTIRILLWSGEEQGLLGSRGYVKKHYADRKTMKLTNDHKKVSAYYNLDNGAGKIRGIHMQGNSEVQPIFNAWLQPFHDLGATTTTIRSTGSTDHISFDEVGIPGFQFIQDPLEYGTRTHHTNMDSYDRVNNNDLMQASLVMASFVYHTANREEKLPRKPMPAIKVVDNYR